MMVIRDLLTLKVSASSRMHSSFALPSTGGEVIFSFNASARVPASPHFDERGITWIFSMTPSAVSRKITCHSSGRHFT